MKKIGYIIIFLLVAALVLGFLKDVIIKASVEKAVGLVTGLRLDIRSMRVGIAKTLVNINSLKLFNPTGYKDTVMLNMPEIYVDYELSDILKGKIHLNEVRINMEEFVVVKNEKGALNLNSLKVVKAQKEGKKPQEGEEAKPPEIQIDELQLKIGKVVYKDYSRGATPSVKEFNVNIDEKYSNITDPYKLVSLIVVKSLMKTNIAGLTNFDLRGLQGTVSDTLTSAQKVASEAAAKAQETLRQTQQTTQKAMEDTQKEAQKALQDTSESLEKVTEDLKKSIKLPFGSSQ